MNFIIPKNFNFHSKLFGLLDYQTAALDAIWGGILFLVVNLLFASISTKVYFFVGLFLPFVIFSIVGVNQENILSVLKYLFKYFKNPKIYLYK